MADVEKPSGEVMTDAELVEALALFERALSRSELPMRRVAVAGAVAPALQLTVTDGAGVHLVEIGSETVWDACRALHQARTPRKVSSDRERAVQRTLDLALGGILSEVELELERDPSVRLIRL